MQPRFPKTITHFLYCNIARNEESFGVFLYILFRKQIIIRKAPFYKLFFDDSGDMLYLEQTQTCHMFQKACFNSPV